MSSARTLSVFYAPRPPDLSYAELYLLLHLAERYDDDKHCSWIRRSELAKRLGCKPPYVKALINRLEEKGYVRVYMRQKRHNRFVIPALPGEVVPGNVVIHEGATIRDPESGQVWTLRTPGQTDEGTEPARIDPATPVDVAAIAAEEAALDEAERAFNAAVAVDPEMERNAQKRGWYDFLVGLQGAPPLGKKAGEWDALINDLMGKEIAMDDFSACYAAAQKKWDAKAVITPTSVYNNWDSLYPIVKAERTVSRRRETMAAKAMASEKPAPLTDEERAQAAVAATAFAERSRQKKAAEEWRRQNNIWKEGHVANCACGTCASNKRQWERQRTTKSATVTG